MKSLQPRIGIHGREGVNHETRKKRRNVAVLEDSLGLSSLSNASGFIL